MNRPPPTSGPLIDWLREEARAPFEEPRGDVGDQLPLQWLVPIAHRDSRVPFAVEHLVREADPLVADRLLRVAALPEMPPSMKQAVARALGAGGAARLAAVETASGHSLLGLAVRALRLPREVGAIPPDALTALHDVTDAKDGWPTSFAVGLVTNPAQFIDVLEASAGQLSDADASEIAFVMLQAGEPELMAALREIGNRSSDATRTRLGAAIKRDLDDAENARQEMLSMGVPLKPAEAAADRWQRYAQTLATNP